MGPGRHGHRGHRAVQNVFNIDEEPVQTLPLGNHKEDTVLVETCRAETAQTDFVKVQNVTYI